MGEEDADAFRGAKDADSIAMRERIESLANESLTSPLLSWEKAEWGLGERRSTEQLLDTIDKGNSSGGRSGRGFFLLSVVPDSDVRSLKPCRFRILGFGSY